MDTFVRVDTEAKTHCQVSHQSKNTLSGQTPWQKTHCRTATLGELITESGQQEIKNHTLSGHRCKQTHCQGSLRNKKHAVRAATEAATEDSYFRMQNHRVRAARNKNTLCQGIDVSRHMGGEATEAKTHCQGSHRS